MRHVALLFASMMATAGTTAAPSLPQALIGYWEADLGSCEGDNFVAYRQDGSFFGYDYEGRWSVHGMRLSTTIIKRMDDDEVWHAVARPKREVSTIVSLAPGRLVERWADGSLHRLHRCQVNVR